MKRLLALALIAGIAQLAGMEPAIAAPGPESICSASTTVFCSGFEEGNFSIWDDWDGNPAPDNTNILDPGPLNISGNHVTRMLVPPGRGGVDVVKLLPSTYDKLYVRYYQKWETGYDFNADNHGGGLHAGDRNLMGHDSYRPTGADWFSAWLEPLDGRLNLYVYYRGMYMDCANPQGSCWGDHFPCIADEGTNHCTKAAHRERIMPPLMQTNRWYCLEYMMDAGSAVQSDAAANGSLDLWIDGIEYGPFNNLWFRTTPSLKINIDSQGVFFHNTHPNVGVQFDNLVISTTHIGCSTPPSGSKTPNPPTNVGTN
jgi:hypothetical protein